VESSSFSLCHGRLLSFQALCLILTLCFAVTATFETFIKWNQTVAGCYSSLIFSQLSVMTLCVFIHDDHLIHKVKSQQLLGAVDFCSVRLILYCSSDILCKNYNYIFLFVQVMPKIIMVPFFPGHGVCP